MRDKYLMHMCSYADLVLFKPRHLCHQAQFCLSALTLLNIVQGTINHFFGSECHKEVGDVIITSKLINFLICFLDREKRYFAPTKVNFQLTRSQKIPIPFGSKMTLRLTLDCTICFLYFLQNYLSLKRDKQVCWGDINKVFLIKKIYSN